MTLEISTVLVKLAGYSRLAGRTGVIVEYLEIGGWKN